MLTTYRHVTNVLDSTIINRLHNRNTAEQYTPEQLMRRTISNEELLECCNNGTSHFAMSFVEVYDRKKSYEHFLIFNKDRIIKEAYTLLTDLSTNKSSINELSFHTKPVNDFYKLARDISYSQNNSGNNNINNTTNSIKYDYLVYDAFQDALTRSSIIRDRFKNSTLSIDSSSIIEHCTRDFTLKSNTNISTFRELLICYCHAVIFGYECNLDDLNSNSLQYIKDMCNEHLKQKFNE